MASTVKVLLITMAVAAVAQLTVATTYTVGAPSGSWDLQTNLTQWVDSNTFHTGDVITFSYNPSAHDVLEVTKSNYDSCTATSPISTSTSGNTMVTLGATGKRYFICGFTGHCSGGMKIEIGVVSSSSGSPAPSSGSTTPPSSVPSTPTSPSPTASSPGTSPPSSGSVGSAAGIGLGLGLATLLVL